MLLVRLQRALKWTRDIVPNHSRTAWHRLGCIERNFHELENMKSKQQRKLWKRPGPKLSAAIVQILLRARPLSMQIPNAGKCTKLKKECEPCEITLTMTNGETRKAWSYLNAQEFTKRSQNIIDKETMENPKLKNNEWYMITIQITWRRLKPTSSER
jgi:hypothetical protein